jgi:hypothetical protein
MGYVQGRGHEHGNTVDMNRYLAMDMDTGTDMGRDKYGDTDRDIVTINEVMTI